MMHPILGFGIMMLAQMEVEKEEWQTRIKKQFRESANFPRKKKKRVRKVLQLEWQITNFDPFTY